MDLILWRHAEAEAGVDDLARSLTPYGQQQARVMAHWLKKQLPPDAIILASEAVRARQTAAALSSEYQVDARLNPDAPMAQVLQVLRWPSNPSTVVYVGHQPTLGHVAAFILGGSDVQSWSVKKGAIWWLRQRVRMQYEQPVLKAMLTPEVLMPLL
jgi:phosphohistidine phosphatase